MKRLLAGIIRTPTQVKLGLTLALVIIFSRVTTHRIIGIKAILYPIMFVAVCFILGAVNLFLHAQQGWSGNISANQEWQYTLTLADCETASITATGLWRWDPAKPAVGPDGDPTCPVACGQLIPGLMGGLIGRVGTNTFVVGSSNVSPPGPGDLDLRINDIGTSDNVGSLSVAIITTPGADSDGDSVPDCIDVCPLRGNQGYGLRADGCPLYVVNANLGWQGTGATVNAGDQVVVKADGQWLYDVTLNCFSPDGNPGHIAGPGQGFPLPDNPIASLVINIGGTVFLAGSNATITAPSSGAISLMMNDNNLVDNQNTTVTAVVYINPVATVTPPTSVGNDYCDVAPVPPYNPAPSPPPTCPIIPIDYPLSWTSDRGLTFDVLISTDPTITLDGLGREILENPDPALSAYGITTTSYNFPAIISSGMHYWQVIAHNGTGISMPSLLPPWCFVVNLPPTAPTYNSPLSPSDGEEYVKLPIMLDWNASFDQEGDSLEYSVLIRNVTDGGNWVTVIPDFTGTDYTLTDTDLLYDKLYEWRIDVSDPINLPVQGPIWQFSTVSSAFCNGIWQVSSRECAGLEALYYATEGDNWTNNSGWMVTSTPCDDWYNVACNADNGIIEIDLRSNNLNGYVPNRIGHFPSLEKLRLGRVLQLPYEPQYESNLSGINPDPVNAAYAIPPTISDLTNLKMLDIQDAQLERILPDEIGNLGNLTTLYLNNNTLSGNIPDTIWGMSSLQVLRLQYNDDPFSEQNNGFTGQLPTPAVIGAGITSNLTELDLCGNSLDGDINASGIFALSSLTRLNLCRNDLTGDFPPALALLVNLRYLSFASNRMGGFIPSNVFPLIAQLEELKLDNNMFWGEIPADIQQLVNLNGSPPLTINYNMLTATDFQLRTFLDSNAESNWYLTQTIPVSDVNLTLQVIDPLTDNSILVEWSPIPYYTNIGGYIVEIATDIDGPYTESPVDCTTLPMPNADIDSKTVTSCTIINGLPLYPGNAYFVRIQTFTYEHGNQKNDLYSLYSEPVWVAIPPKHDRVENADTISSLPFADTTDTTGASVYAGDPVFPCVTNVTHTVHYMLDLQAVGLNNPQGRHYLDGDVVLDFDTVGSKFDTVIAVFDENGNLVGSNCNNDAVYFPQDAASETYAADVTWPIDNIPADRFFDSTASRIILKEPYSNGTVYHIVIGGNNGDFGRMYFAVDSAPYRGCTDANMISIPQSECAELVNMRDATDDLGWTYNYGWDIINRPCTSWYGVQCGVGRVAGVDLSANNLVGDVPDVSGLTALQLLNLSGNQLTGNLLTTSLPPSLFTLDLSSNQLIGTLPNLSGISGLEVLNLSHNDLDGSISETFLPLSLLELDLSFNHLDNNIPDFSSFSSLQMLNLSANRLSWDWGAPTAFPSNLIALYLDNNQLGSDIPIAFTNLSNLATLDIGYNMLSASDLSVHNFLYDRQSDWNTTQTVPMINFMAGEITPTSVTWDWVPILYTGDGGNYQIFYISVNPGGTCEDTWPHEETTSDKTVNHYTISGLDPDTTYWFCARTHTPVHDPPQQNDLRSNFIGPVTYGVNWFVITEQEFFDQMQIEIANNPGIQNIEFALADFFALVDEQTPGGIKLTVRTPSGVVYEVTMTLMDTDVGYIIIGSPNPPINPTIDQELHLLVGTSLNALLDRKVGVGHDLDGMTVTDTVINVGFFR